MTNQGQQRHPYQEFKGTPEYAALDKAITELVENQDIQESTARAYIVGYLCKALASLKLQ